MKEDGIMNSIMLQNPSDSETTYRNKAGKIHRGYVANIDKSADASGSIVSDYQYGQNIHSDSQFLRESITEAEISEDMLTLITDDGYGGGDNTKLAKEKNIDLITTDLVGKDAPNVLADFQFSEDGTKLEKCAAPILLKSAIIRNPSNRNDTWEKMISHIMQGCGRESKRFFPNIQRNYHLEKTPWRKQRGKFFFRSKIVTLNFRKLEFVKLNV